MLTISIIVLGFTNLAFSFPFPEECGVNFIQPDNIQNASRFLGKHPSGYLRGLCSGLSEVTRQCPAPGRGRRISSAGRLDQRPVGAQRRPLLLRGRGVRGLGDSDGGARRHHRGGLGASNGRGEGHPPSEL